MWRPYGATREMVSGAMSPYLAMCLDNYGTAADVIRILHFGKPAEICLILAAFAAYSTTLKG